MKRGGLDLGVLNKRSPASCISIHCGLTGFGHSHALHYTSAKKISITYVHYHEKSPFPSMVAIDETRSSEIRNDGARLGILRAGLS